LPAIRLDAIHFRSLKPNRSHRRSQSYVGASLLAKSLFQTTHMFWLYCPLREQARSHKDRASQTKRIDIHDTGCQPGDTRPQMDLVDPNQEVSFAP